MAQCNRRSKATPPQQTSQQTNQQPTQSTTQQPTQSNEPAMRRWPHPVVQQAHLNQEDATAQYVRCALAYQNQILADIKTLLQQLAQQE